MEATEQSDCTHKRQVRIANTDEWVCEDCMALMDADDPTWVLDWPVSR
jgi:hypothetical protein